VFVAHWTGLCEWERQPADEVVILLEGRARAFLVQDGKEIEHALCEGQLIVIPENTWHRFETAGVKMLTVTQRPTEHEVDFPGEAPARNTS
jgi:mannose-6-phosphate isomerase-like protein (cupin superfamily)